MTDGNDQEQVLTGEQLLREISCELDRHGFEITERHSTHWILRKSSGGDMQLEIQNFVLKLNRCRTLAQQRRMLYEVVAWMSGGGGAGGSVNKI